MNASAPDQSTAHGFILFKPSKTDEKKLVVAGLYDSLPDAQEAATALQNGRVRTYLRATAIQEWHGDTLVAEYRFQSETGWAQSIETFDSRSVAATIRELVDARRDDVHDATKSSTD